ncbi:MAG: DUF4190 domain-containing protein [Bifidobacteriaceae bacterium]|nr:DUF4190 domain-containing protein [Bifidobacteriaceae bacterium]
MTDQSLNAPSSGQSSGSASDPASQQAPPGSQPPIEPAFQAAYQPPYALPYQQPYQATYQPPYVAPGFAPGAYPPGAYLPPYGTTLVYQPYQMANPERKSKNAFGVLSLVLSLVGLLVLPFVGVVSITGTVFGHLGIRAASQGKADNKGLAIGGLVVGYVGIAYFLFLVWLFALFWYSQLASEPPMLTLWSAA